ncbi:hypothetical protein OIU74_022596 [Salix koriyanagi]|uniref:Malectin-like domain-containing protein n=1 Tax=Salix koriyanagi TaxID=2511006 RepID=A0A9Q1AF70_9ROSI|nr:hypothetical protein OIU74_022596 [Salix koriyanagi]
MFRSTYFYGGINGNDSPPELMEHSSVANTMEDYRDGMSWIEGRLRVSVLLQIRTRNLTVPLPHSTYYIALYFVHDHNSLPNGVPYYKNLTVTPAVVVVFATKWPLSGLTAIALTPTTGSSIDLLINVGEVFDVIALKNTYKRCARLVQVVLIYNFKVGGIGVGFIIELCFEFVTSIDSTVFMGFLFVGAVIALEALKSSFQNAPLDCNGNPCMPRQFSWTGIACFEGPPDSSGYFESDKLGSFRITP